MKLLVTGATGFLGQRVVQAALERGHTVRALVRPGRAPLAGWEDVELARADLRRRAGLAEAVRGVDAVLHLAAAKSGDLYAQLAGTVVATENLLAAMHAEGVDRLVLTSSFSVYGYQQLPRGAVVDEETPLETALEGRDDYCRTKLLQERLVREAGRDWLRATVLRPGVIWGGGPDNLWTSRIGVQAGPRLWLRVGGRALLPLVYVENCAEAVVLAAEREEAVGRTYVVVDDELRTQAEYARALAAALPAHPRVVGAPWPLFRAAASAAWWVNQLGCGGRAKVPAILRPGALHARCKPSLRYSNQRLRRELGWRPRYGFEEALARSLRGGAGTPNVATPQDRDACVSPT